MSESISVQEVTSLLRGNSLLCRTALLLGDSADGVKCEELSIQLGMGLVDCVRLRLSELESPGPTASLDRDAAIGILDTACQVEEGKSVILVLNWDLILARLTHEDRQYAWRFVWGSFKKRSKGLLLFVPRNADALLPSAKSIDEWRRAHRLVEGWPKRGV